MVIVLKEIPEYVTEAYIPDLLAMYMCNRLTYPRQDRFRACIK